MAVAAAIKLVGGRVCPLPVSGQIPVEFGHVRAAFLSPCERIGRGDLRKELSGTEVVVGQQAQGIGGFPLVVVKP